jgi:DNA-binding NarL/FixJ family response regulator
LSVYFLTEWLKSRFLVKVLFYKPSRLFFAESDRRGLMANPLTEREKEVIELIVEGCSNEEICKQLYISLGTVKTHVRNILNKLSCDDRTQAAVRALRAGLVD